MSDFRVSLSAGDFVERVFRAAAYTYTDGKQTATNLDELIGFYKAYGSTEVWARIATDRGGWEPVGELTLEEVPGKSITPSDGRVHSSPEHTLENGLNRARLAKKHGKNTNF